MFNQIKNFFSNQKEEPSVVDNNPKNEMQAAQLGFQNLLKLITTHIQSTAADNIKTLLQKVENKDQIKILQPLFDAKKDFFLPSLMVTWLLNLLEDKNTILNEEQKQTLYELLKTMGIIRCFLGDGTKKNPGLNKAYKDCPTLDRNTGLSAFFLPMTTNTTRIGKIIFNYCMNNVLNISAEDLETITPYKQLEILGTPQNWELIKHIIQHQDFISTLPENLQLWWPFVTTIINNMTPENIQQLISLLKPLIPEIINIFVVENTQKHIETLITTLINNASTIIDCLPIDEYLLTLIPKTTLLSLLPMEKLLTFLPEPKPAIEDIEKLKSSEIIHKYLTKEVLETLKSTEIISALDQDLLTIIKVSIPILLKDICAQPQTKEIIFECRNLPEWNIWDYLNKTTALLPKITEVLNGVMDKSLPQILDNILDLPDNKTSKLTFLCFIKKIFTKPKPSSETGPQIELPNPPTIAGLDVIPEAPESQENTQSSQNSQIPPGTNPKLTTFIDISKKLITHYLNPQKEQKSFWQTGLELLPKIAASYKVCDGIIQIIPLIHNLVEGLKNSWDENQWQNIKQILEEQNINESTLNQIVAKIHQIFPTTDKENIKSILDPSKAVDQLMLDLQNLIKTSNKETANSDSLVKFLEDHAGELLDMAQMLLSKEGKEIFGLLGRILPSVNKSLSTPSAMADDWIKHPETINLLQQIFKQQSVQRLWKKLLKSNVDQTVNKLLSGITGWWNAFLKPTVITKHYEEKAPEEPNIAGAMIDIFMGKTGEISNIVTKINHVLKEVDDVIPEVKIEEPPIIEPLDQSADYVDLGYDIFLGFLKKDNILSMGKNIFDISVLIPQFKKFDFNFLQRFFASEFCVPEFLTRLGFDLKTVTTPAGQQALQSYGQKNDILQMWLEFMYSKLKTPNTINIVNTHIFKSELIAQLFPLLDTTKLPDLNEETCHTIAETTIKFLKDLPKDLLKPIYRDVNNQVISEEEGNKQGITPDINPMGMVIKNLPNIYRLLSTEETNMKHDTQMRSKWRAIQSVKKVLNALINKMNTDDDFLRRLGVKSLETSEGSMPAATNHYWKLLYILTAGVIVSIFFYWYLYAGKTHITPTTELYSQESIDDPQPIPDPYPHGGSQAMEPDLHGQDYQKLKTPLILKTNHSSISM